MLIQGLFQTWLKRRCRGMEIGIPLICENHVTT